MLAARPLAMACLLGLGLTALAADGPPAPTTPTDPATGEKLDPHHGKIVAEWRGKLQKVAGDENGGLITLRIDQAVPVARGRQVRTQRLSRDQDFPLAKDVIVRQMVLPPVEDENGKPRQRTIEELRRLKGTGLFPGYIAQLSDLHAGAVVRIQLMQPKPAKGAKPTDPAPKPLVTMIVLENAPAPTTAAPKK